MILNILAWLLLIAGLYVLLPLVLMSLLFMYLGSETYRKQQAGEPLTWKDKGILYWLFDRD